MRVLMRTQYAGPGGCVAPGETADLPTAEAQAVIRGGFAVDAAAEEKRAAAAKAAAAADGVEPAKKK